MRKKVKRLFFLSHTIYNALKEVCILCNHDDWNHNLPSVLYLKKKLWWSPSSHLINGKIFFIAIGIFFYLILLLEDQPSVSPNSDQASITPSMTCHGIRWHRLRWWAFYITKSSSSPLPHTPCSYPLNLLQLMLCEGDSKIVNIHT